MKVAAVTVLVASSAQAGCPIGSELLLYCEFPDSPKRLESCLVGDTVTYTFGDGGVPELAMSRHVREVDFVPWPGVGRWIWEEFTLKNSGYSYSVHYAVERIPDNMKIGGGIIVKQGEAVLAYLDCDTDTVNFSGFPSPIFDAKVAAGQSWSFETKLWSDPD